LNQVFDLRPRPAVTWDQWEIIARIQEMHAQALAGAFRYAGGRTVLRDAALLAVLASRAPRIGEIAAMDMGRDLIWRGDRWAMLVTPSANKNARARQLSLPDWAQPIVNDYVTIGRPRLGGDTTPALWLSTQHARCPISTLTGRVVHWTRLWTGTPHGPHWLRKCFTTTIANEQPELLGDAAIVLDHGPAVAAEHYNLAESLIAGRRHNERLAARLHQGEAAGRDYLDRHRPPRPKKPPQSAPGPAAPVTPALPAADGPPDPI
jgi:hypothetical protein